MKIIKIFGVVVAVHAAVFLFIFAIPGCRSTGRPAADDAGAARVSVAADAAGSSPVIAAPAAGSGLSPVIAPAAAPASVTFDPNAPATVRSSPTRPGSAAASSLTPAAPAPAKEAPVNASYSVVKGDSLWSIAQKHKVSVHDLAAANNIPVSSTLRLGQKLIVPAAAASPGSGSAAVPAGTVAYTVKSGDSLGLIARRNGTTPTVLRQLNNLKSDTVRAGQTLQVPPAAAGAAAATPDSTPAPTSGSQPADGEAVVHVIKAGETLGAIAHKYGVPIGEIAKANNIADPKKIRPGQELKIPHWQPPAAKGATAATPADVPAAPVDAVLPPPPADSPVIAVPPSAPPADGPVIKVESSGAPAIP